MDVLCILNEVYSCINYPDDSDECKRYERNVIAIGLVMIASASYYILGDKIKNCWSASNLKDDEHKPGVDPSNGIRDTGKPQRADSVKNGEQNPEISKNSDEPLDITDEKDKEALFNPIDEKDEEEPSDSITGEHLSKLMESSGRVIKNGQVILSEIIEDLTQSWRDSQNSAQREKIEKLNQKMEELHHEILTIDSDVKQQGKNVEASHFAVTDLQQSLRHLQKYLNPLDSGFEHLVDNPTIGEKWKQRRQALSAHSNWVNGFKSLRQLLISLFMSLHPWASNIFEVKNSSAEDLLLSVAAANKVTEFLASKFVSHLKNKKRENIRAVANRVTDHVNELAAELAYTLAVMYSYYFAAIQSGEVDKLVNAIYVELRDGLKKINADNIIYRDLPEEEVPIEQLAFRFGLLLLSKKRTPGKLKMFDEYNWTVNLLLFQTIHDPISDEVRFNPNRSKHYGCQLIKYPPIVSRLAFFSEELLDELEMTNLEKNFIEVFTIKKERLPSDPWTARITRSNRNEKVAEMTESSQLIMRIHTQFGKEVRQLSVCLASVSPTSEQLTFPRSQASQPPAITDQSIDAVDQLRMG